MGKKLNLVQQTFFFCEGDSCRKKGSEQIIRIARSYLRNKDLWDKTHTIKTRCNGRCEDAPTCIVQEGNHWYKQVTPEKIISILDSHINHNIPVEEYLLFKNGSNKVDSENELKPFKPQDFKKVEDNKLGPCYLTKGLSSDQYLFPLFQFLKEINQGAVLILNENQRFDIKDLTDVNYIDPYTLTLTFTGNKSVNLVIGAVPKHESEKLTQNKITSTEYFMKEDGSNRGIMFKNRKGTQIAEILLKEDSDVIWDYCLNIQLSKKLDPTKKSINV